MFNVHKQKPFTENHESLIIGLFDKPSNLKKNFPISMKHLMED